MTAAALTLSGRSVVVVGGASGIGLATAELARDLGAAVTVVDLADDPPVDEGIAVRRGDATDAEQVATLLAEVAEAHDGLDGVVTTVGGAHIATIGELDPAAFDAEVRFNLTSAYAVTRAALAVMRPRRRGAVVLTGTGYADLPAPDRPAYAAAKAGVHALTRSVATEAAADGVRVNCIAPGPTDTPRFRAMNGGDEGVERVRRGMPLGRIPEPIDCAWMAVFLLSDAARNITGQTIHVNGGIYAP